MQMCLKDVVMILGNLYISESENKKSSLSVLESPLGPDLKYYN